MIAVPGRVTFALVPPRIVVAMVAARVAWPVWAAVPVTIVAAAPAPRRAVGGTRSGHRRESGHAVRNSGPAGGADRRG